MVMLNTYLSGAFENQQLKRMFNEVINVLSD